MTSNAEHFAAALAAVEQAQLLPLPTGGVIVHLPGDHAPIVLTPETVEAWVRLVFPALTGPQAASVAAQLSERARPATKEPRDMEHTKRTIQLPVSLDASLRAERVRLEQVTGLRVSLNNAIANVLQRGLDAAVESRPGDIT